MHFFGLKMRNEFFRTKNAFVGLKISDYKFNFVGLKMHIVRLNCICYKNKERKTCIMPADGTCQEPSCKPWAIKKNLLGKYPSYPGKTKITKVNVLINLVLASSQELEQKISVWSLSFRKI
jgi:hypothetical protein